MGGDRQKEILGRENEACAGEGVEEEERKARMI